MERRTSEVRKYDVPGTGLVFQTWSRFFYELWDWIWERDLVDDLRQECYLIALLVRDLEGKERLRKIQSLLYQFCKKYGFRKVWPSLVWRRSEILEAEREEGER